jgi:HAE1 family hydrophobic/amphiphilic exporter-1
VVLSPGASPPVRVRDVATVTDGWEEPRGFVRLDGREAVGILVHRRAGANQLRLAEDVRVQLDRLAAEFPELSLAIVADSSPFVRQAVDGVWQAMWLGGLLAFAVLFLFLRDARSPLFLMIALPVSAIVTFAVLDRLGTSLNLMSLGGIALGVGMLVDNGIVCLENVHRLRATGLSPEEAAARGAREIAMPILASTLTTCAVFVPLAFVPGTVGTLFRDQAIAVSVSLLASWLVALTLLPMLVARFPGPVDAEVRRPLFALYHRALSAGLRRPGRLLAGTAIGILASGVALAFLPRELLPEVATDHLELRLEAAPGTDVTATDAGARRLEDWLAERDEVSSVLVTVGDVGSLDPADPARRAHRASVRLVLSDPSPARRAGLTRDLLDVFGRDPSLALEIVPDAPELATLLGGGQATLTCDVRGPDDELAESLARDLAQRSGVDGVELLASEREPRLRMVPRDDAMWRLGLTEEDVVPAVEALGSGQEATRLRRFDEEVPVRIRMASASSPAEGNVVVRGRSFPVDELFRTTVELAPATRWREDRARLASIRWDGPLRDASAARASLAAAAAERGLPPGYTLTFGGAWREMAETGRALARAFALSAGLVLLVLAAQFESVRLPVLIFAAVPMALPGVAAALIVTRGTLNVLSGIGLVVLIGIVVNDAILKVDLLRRFRAEGRSRRDAILAASRRRYRPIVMTTLTTAFGLAPLLFGRGAELRAPLAATLTGGLLSATVLTLIVIPILFERIAGRFAADSPEAHPATPPRPAGEPA